jgi:hypothetical protein
MRLRQGDTKAAPSGRTPRASRGQSGAPNAQARLTDDLFEDDLVGVDETPPATPAWDAMACCARLWSVCTKQPYDPDHTPTSPEFLAFLDRKGPETPRITPLFDPDYYSAQISWQNEPINYLLHYCQATMEVDVGPHVLFDDDYVLSQSGLAAFEAPPLLHFLEANDPSISPHPLFDPALYAQSVGEDFLGGDHPVIAFIERWAERPAPFSPYFSRRFYGLHEPVVRYGGLNPLIHFLSMPPERRRDPNPMFHRGWYAASLAPDALGDDDPLVHYIRHGLAMGLMPNPFAQSELRAGSLGLPALVDALRRYLSFPPEGGAIEALGALKAL